MMTCEHWHVLVESQGEGGTEMLDLGACSGEEAAKLIRYVYRMNDSIRGTITPQGLQITEAEFYALRAAVDATSRISRIFNDFQAAKARSAQTTWRAYQ